MTTDPGEECGVTGGCGACPLFVHNICGDPAPTDDLPGMWEVADYTGGQDEVRTAVARTGPLCGSCDAGLPMSCTCAAVTEYLDEVLDPDGYPPHLGAVDAAHGIRGILDTGPHGPHGMDGLDLPAWQARINEACRTLADPRSAYVVPMRWVAGFDSEHGTPDPVSVCVQTSKAVVPCGTAAYCTSREGVERERELRAAYGLDVEHRAATLAALVKWDNEAALHPDAPDCDPNEPRPEGAGCCGGGRCG